MVDVFDIIVDAVFFLTTLIIFIFIIVSLFNIKNIDESKPVSLSSPIFYFFLFVTFFFALIKFYQYSNKFKAKQMKKLKGE